jgi:hypothetical protein
VRDRLSADITAAVSERLPGAKVVINFGVMNDEEREAVKKLLRGGREKFNPFAQPDSLTRVWNCIWGGEWQILRHRKISLLRQPRAV